MAFRWKLCLINWDDLQLLKKPFSEMVPFYGSFDELIEANGNKSLMIRFYINKSSVFSLTFLDFSWQQTLEDLIDRYEGNGISNNYIKLIM